MKSPDIAGKCAFSDASFFCPNKEDFPNQKIAFIFEEVFRDDGQFFWPTCNHKQM